MLGQVCPEKSVFTTVPCEIIQLSLHLAFHYQYVDNLFTFQHCMRFVSTPDAGQLSKPVPATSISNGERSKVSNCSYLKVGTLEKIPCTPFWSR